MSGKKAEKACLEERRKEQMVRLTEKEASGRWSIRGIAWEALGEGKVITKDVAQRLYGCLCKLKDYEDIGLNPDELENLLYDLKDTAEHACDELCRHRREAAAQKELDVICAGCKVSVMRSKIGDLL